MKLKKKIKLHKEKSTLVQEEIAPRAHKCCGKEEIAKLKASYKSKSLQLDSKEIAKAMLQEEEIKEWLTK